MSAPTDSGRPGAAARARNGGAKEAGTLRTPRLPAAVLWDLDGTLIDSEPYWMAEERALVERYGGVWTDAHGHAVVGQPLLVSAEYLRAHSPVDLNPLEVVRTLQAGVMARLARVLPWRPGARELLLGLREEGVPCALVTMSWRPMADAVVAALPAGAFAAVITGDEVRRGKPHPEPYLRAAAALDVPPAHCVAIEDSLTGAQSALAAGARTLAVEHVVAVPGLPRLHRAVSLEGVRPADLMTLTAGSDGPLAR